MGEPTQRRDSIDVARILALLVVVLGHLLLAVIDRRGDEVRGANLLALHPGWAWVAALAPMPVFFAAGGWANARSTLATATARARTLVGLGAVVVGAWSAAVVIASLVVGDGPGIVGDGARIATQPLWFVAAYVPFAVAGERVGRLAAARGPVLIASSLLLLAALDVARFGLDAPEWIGWPGFFLAWGTPWVAGGWWRARWESGGLDERWEGLRLAALAGVGAVALVAFADYDPALIDAVPGARSNTTPPTLYTAMAALAQVGLLVAGARALDRVGRRWRSVWDRAGEAAVGVYVWHLTALSLCAAVIAAGLPVPDRLTVSWWLTRPLWWGAVLAVTLAFVVPTGALRARLARGRVPSSDADVRRTALGVLVAVAAGATVGLEGPRSIPLALACSALFAAGWWLLRVPAR